MQKISKASFFSGLLLGCGFCLFSSQMLAQAQVVEAGSSQNNNPASNPVAADNSQSEIMMNMYLQLEALQAEIQNLRGLVDEQSYMIRRLQTEQRDRYLDTDSRLSEINNQVQAFHRGQAVTGNQTLSPTTPLANNAVNAGVANNPVRANPVTGATGNNVTAGAAIAGTAPQSEQELYRAALNLLLEEEAFAESISLFQQYVERYPRGRYLTNSLYWQGAAMELAGRYPQAIVVLQRLINEFPADAKAPTAILRLGTVYREMGDSNQAAAQWRRISQLYPDSTSEIELANEYLSELNN